MNYYDHPYISNSTLSKYKFEMQGRSWSDIPKKTLDFGNLVDGLITEPESVNHIELTQNGNQFTKEEFQKAIAMRDAFYKNMMCRMLTGKSETQREFYVKNVEIKALDHHFKLNMRCKLDFFSPYASIDLKTTTATTQKQFESAIDQFDWDRQGAVYMRLANVNRHLIVGVSKEAPHKIFKVPIEFGSELHKRGTEKFHYLAVNYYINKIKKNEKVHA